MLNDSPAFPLVPKTTSHANSFALLVDSRLSFSFSFFIEVLLTGLRSSLQRYPTVLSDLVGPEAVDAGANAAAAVIGLVNYTTF